jgi:hypothetical protein
MGRILSIVITQPFPNLEQPSVIIMDNASYHSVLLEERPTQSWRKNQIIASKKEDSHPEGSFKTDLLNLANTYKFPRKR